MTLTYKLDADSNKVQVFQGDDTNATMSFPLAVAERQIAANAARGVKVVRVGF